MKKNLFPFTLAGLLVLAAPCVLPAQHDIDEEFCAEIAKVANFRKAGIEDTRKARNEMLNQLFRKYVERLGDGATGQAVKQFNVMLKECGLISFDEFLAVQTTPLRYVTDPVSGRKLPVLGPLGSDAINRWLTAAGVAEGQSLEKQPMYRLASKVLGEHIDFALVGMKDPNLSFELLPPELRESARWAYGRLNPTNEFDGGFDHPLFYATVREAARKLFRQDHPEARLSMADLVLPEKQGGFGIRSCLLCHDDGQNDGHNGVYKRLLGQSLVFEATAAKLRERQGVSLNSASGEKEDEHVRQSEATAATFRLAAQRVLDAVPDKIDREAIRLSHLKPGYDDFYATLKGLGCMKCHSTESNEMGMGLAKKSNFVLSPERHYQTKNIAALLSVIDMDDISNSKLLLKARGRVKHLGNKELVLDDAQMEESQRALTEWVDSLKTNQPK